MIIMIRPQLICFFPKQKKSTNPIPLDESDIFTL